MALFFNIYQETASNKIIQLVLIAIVIDTIFGVCRAIREHKLNSCFGIDGAIRKVSMIISIMALVIVDKIINLNLIGFIPQEVRQYMPGAHIGIAEFFAMLYIAYEIVSILKNMTLCGLPVKRVWAHVRKLLGKYTDELPDADELECIPQAENKSNI